MNDYYDMGDDYSGDWGVNYGDASGPEYNDYDFGDDSVSGDWGFDYSGGYSEPTYGGDVGAFGNVDGPADYGDFSSPGLWDQLQGLPGKMGDQFMKKLEKNPLGILASLGANGMALYGSMKQNKARDAAAREMRDARAAREARIAELGAPINYTASRTMTPQTDLLHAGERYGGNQWFSPTKFTKMADGGQVKQGWLDALFSRKPSPAMVGSGTAARAGDAIQDRNYQLYLQMQEMDGARPLPYDVWAQSRQGRGMAEGGALSQMDPGMMGGNGTSDDIPINASEGEYVIDAQSVSDLGNGSNEAGARILDQMLQNLRAHRREAPNSEIPPDAKPPEAYMPGGG